LTAWPTMPCASRNGTPAATEQRRLLPQLRVDLRQALAARAVLARRDVVGGTAPDRVRTEVTRWQQQLAAMNDTNR
jgi:argininosuccinate lyase